MVLPVLRAQVNYVAMLALLQPSVPLDLVYEVRVGSVKWEIQNLEIYFSCAALLPANTIKPVGISMNE